MEVSGRKDSDLKTKLVCQPCHSDGDNVSAEGYCETCNEYFCSACLKVHRKQSATKNHVIKSKDDMPRGHVQTDPCSEPCVMHKTEIVKFYCKHHDEVGCGDCMILKHKACKVQLVTDVSGNYGNSEELHEIKQRIERLQKEISTRKNVVEYNLKAAAKINRKVVEEIMKFRKDINTYLDNVEGALLKEAEQLLKNDVSLQSKLQEECDSVKREIKQFQSELNNNSEMINKLFVTAKLAHKRLQEFQQSAKRIASESHINSYTFQASKDLMTIQSSNSVLGTIIRQDKKPMKKGKWNMADMKAEFVKSLNVKAADEGFCWITGIASISCDEILLADCKNVSLKILNVTEGKITSKYSSELPSAPWDVTVISEETAAVTFPGKGIIMFMNTTNGLSKSHTLTVRKECRGIDHKSGIMAVSFCLPPAVQILNLDGVVLHEVSEASMFSYPGHIRLSSDNRHMYVSDNDHDILFQLTLSGQFNAAMKLDECPSNLCVTNDGTVIVCCEGSNDSVCVVSPEAKGCVSFTVKHVKRPTSVFCCDENNKMFICGSDSNDMKLFYLK